MSTRLHAYAGICLGMLAAAPAVAVSDVELGKMLLGPGYEQVNQGYLQKNANVPRGSNSGSGTLGYHPGIDYRARTPKDVYSPVDGVVEQTSSGGRDIAPGKDTFGTIVVKVDGSDMRFLFVHMSSSTVSAGTRVTTGCVIGRSGETGIPGAPHLHVEARSGKRNAALYFASASDPGVNKDPAAIVPRFVPVNSSRKCG